MESGRPVNRPGINRNEFTGSLAGPIVKNKTFFFALFDKQLNVTAKPRGQLRSPNVRSVEFSVTGPAGGPAISTSKQ